VVGMVTNRWLIGQHRLGEHRMGAAVQVWVGGSRRGPVWC
jgi:hypothetical protein